MSAASSSRRRPGTHPFSLSPTALRAYDECPRRFAYAYIDKEPPEERPGPQLILANAIHAALADLFRLEPSERNEEISHRMLRHHWLRQRGREKAFLSAEEEAAWGYDALAMLSRFCHNRPEELGLRVLAVEDWIRAPLDHGHVVGGRLDRAERVPVAGVAGGEESGGDGVEEVQGLRVTDYKTGRCRIDGAEELAEDRGAQIYAVAATRTYRIRVTEVRFLYLPEDVAVSWHPEAEDLAALEQRLASEIDGIVADAELEARPDYHCRWCGFREICPAQKLRAEDFAETPGTVF
jgi:RecB family exonuclease